jgi:hypothetical protein
MKVSEKRRPDLAHAGNIGDRLLDRAPTLQVEAIG